MQRFFVFFCVAVTSIWAQGTVPTFQYSNGKNSYTVVGQAPSEGRTSTIPTVLVPIDLTSSSDAVAGSPHRMNAASDVHQILRSPVFSRSRFDLHDNTQYVDAMLHGVAVGFRVGATTFPEVTAAMDYIISGKRPPAATYGLRNPAGYGSMIGAMFWTIDADQNENYTFSNKVGPLLHAYSAAK